MEKRWKILLITSVGLFMGSLDLFIVNLALPSIAKDFDNASLTSLSWVLNAYAIVFAALLVPAGRVADRVGRKRVFLAGLLIFSLASALCAAAPSVPFLVAARTLADCVGQDQLDVGAIYPDQSSLREVSRRIAVAVVREVQRASLRPVMSDEAIEKLVADSMWYPDYPVLES